MCTPKLKNQFNFGIILNVIRIKIVVSRKKKKKNFPNQPFYFQNENHVSLSLKSLFKPIKSIFVKFGQNTIFTLEIPGS